MSNNPTVVLRIDGPMAIRIPRDRHRWPHLLLHDLTGPGTRHPHWDTERAAWLLPRSQDENVILGLADRLGEVTVFQYVDPEVPCGSSCQGAQSPTMACTCACAGRGHGLGHPPAAGDDAFAVDYPGYTLTEAEPDQEMPAGILRHYVVRSDSFRRPAMPSLGMRHQRSLELDALEARQAAEEVLGRAHKVPEGYYGVWEDGAAVVTTYHVTPHGLIRAVRDGREFHLSHADQIRVSRDIAQNIREAREAYSFTTGNCPICLAPAPRDAHLHPACAVA